jgi:hypothetical protein
MNEYNTITIEECNGRTYTEQVGWSFDEAAKMLLGKEGKCGSLIYQVHMDEPVKIQGCRCGGRRTAVYED